MFTQCQHCLTMFRITPEQLKAADGLVRCCQCNNVFNALQNLKDLNELFVNEDELQESLAVHGQNEIATDTDSRPLDEETASNGFMFDSNLVTDSEIEKSLDALADDESPTGQLGEESILQGDEISSDSDNHKQFLLERDDGLESEPDYLAAGTESQMSELLDQDSASLLLEERGGNAQLAEVISFDLHDTESHAAAESITSSEEAFSEERPTTPTAEPSPAEEPRTSDGESLVAEASTTTEDETYTAGKKSIIRDEDLEKEPVSGFIPQGYSAAVVETKPRPQDSLDEESRFTFEEDHEKPQPNRYRRYWGLASLLLLLPLGGQIAWHLRDSLVTHYAGRQILQGFCNLAGCEVPTRRDTDQIIITNRALTAHPEKEDVLMLKLEMMNAAAFQQPFPKLQLSLYNDMGEIIARRTFLPDEYRTNHRSMQMMPKSKAVHVELELKDPGKEVTGFKFDFL